MHWGDENCVQGLLRKHEGKRLLRRYTIVADGRRVLQWVSRIGQEGVD